VGRPIRQQSTFVGVGGTRRGLCPGPRPGQAQFFSHLGKQRVETRETHLFTSIQADRERPRQGPPRARPAAGGGRPRGHLRHPQPRAGRRHHRHRGLPPGAVRGGRHRRGAHAGP